MMYYADSSLDVNRHELYFKHLEILSKLKQKQSNVTAAAAAGIQHKHV